MTAATSARKADAARFAELESEPGLPPSDPDGIISPELAAKTQPAIVSLRSAKNPAEEKRIPAFSINGVTYSILTQPRVNQGLKYVHLARTKGSEIAVDYMLEVLLGVEGYAALIEFDDLTEDDLKAVIDAASRIMAGAVETPKGKQPRGSARSRG
jgi:hypothetical protein